MLRNVTPELKNAMNVCVPFGCTFTFNKNFHFCVKNEQLDFLNLDDNAVLPPSKKPSLIEFRPS